MISRTVIVTMLMTSSFLAVYGQPALPLSVNCERNTAIMDVLGQSIKSEQKIFVISYIGAKEYSDNAARRRLYNTSTYLLHAFDKTRSSPILESQVVLGLAPVRMPTPRLDIYIDGKLEETLYFPVNGDFRLGPCVTDTSDICKDDLQSKLYPCAARKPRRPS